MRKRKSNHLPATLFSFTVSVLVICFVSCGWGRNKSEESKTSTSKSNLIIKKIIDTYNNNDKLYLFHFGSMSCAPCIHEFESFKEGSGSDKYHQVIVILLDDDKNEFNKRFDFSKFGIDVLCYNEKGFSVEDVRELGEGLIGFSLLYDSTGEYLTNNEEKMNNYLVGYKLGFITAQLKYNPNDFNAHLEWGQLMDSRGRYNEAIAELELCKELKPDHFEVRFLLSTVYFRAGMFEKAIEELEPIIPKTSEPMRENFTTVLNEYKRYQEISQQASKSKK
ncbi:MAG: tetratricopeptide repeat protein [Sedimentisphaerales bacterium]|nr:tetratricopeptide repeat protein [Sedimentisphaerales bacterium]